MQSIAIIPARGGSKRLPRKNVLPFLGKPMLLWTVEAARTSGAFERIFISTEDEEIAAIGTENGVEVLRRPEGLAADTATCANVCLHHLNELENLGQSFDTLCCLYATAPLRTAEDIIATMRLLEDDGTGEADFAFAVTEYSHSPYQALIQDAVGYLSPLWPVLVSHQSQILPKPVIGNGSTYAARVNAFRRHRSFYGPRLRGHTMPYARSIDIDTQEDLDIALCFAKYWGQEK